MSGTASTIRRSIEWPQGKQFAFTITDDTDLATTKQIKPIYEVLKRHGLRTTKTVWPLRALGAGITGGSSLEDDDYLHWILQLKDDGFEIAMHGVADETSTRSRVQLGLERYEELIGARPSMHINHVGQREAMYWGRARLNWPLSWFYAANLWRRKGMVESEGHRAGSPLFWGDLCKQQVRFVRNLVWHEINTTKADPLFPYHDPAAPHVNYWFSGSYGSGLANFLRLVRPENLDRLAAEGGACIVYTHFGAFPTQSAAFEEAIAGIGRMNGWFVPASTLIQHVGSQRGWTDVNTRRIEFRAMQYRWMLQQLRTP